PPPQLRRPRALERYLFYARLRLRGFPLADAVKIGSEEVWVWARVRVSCSRSKAFLGFSLEMASHDFKHCPGPSAPPSSQVPVIFPSGPSTPKTNIFYEKGGFPSAQINQPRQRQGKVSSRAQRNPVTSSFVSQLNEPLRLGHPTNHGRLLPGATHATASHVEARFPSQFSNYHVPGRTNSPTVPSRDAVNLENYNPTADHRRNPVTSSFVSQLNEPLRLGHPINHRRLLPGATHATASHVEAKFPSQFSNYHVPGRTNSPTVLSRDAVNLENYNPTADQRRNPVTSSFVSQLNEPLRLGHPTNHDRHLPGATHVTASHVDAKFPSQFSNSHVPARTRSLTLPSRDAANLVNHYPTADQRSQLDEPLRPGHPTNQDRPLHAASHISGSQDVEAKFPSQVSNDGVPGRTRSP
ncbi:unnamed protein product, partial [Musa textilis]